MYELCMCNSFYNNFRHSIFFPFLFFVHWIHFSFAPSHSFIHSLIQWTRPVRTLTSVIICTGIFISHIILNDPRALFSSLTFGLSSNKRVMHLWNVQRVILSPFQLQIYSISEPEFHFCSSNLCAPPSVAFLHRTFSWDDFLFRKCIWFYFCVSLIGQNRAYLWIFPIFSYVNVIFRVFFYFDCIMLKFSQPKYAIYIC